MPPEWKRVAGKCGDCSNEELTKSAVEASDETNLDKCSILFEDPLREVGLSCCIYPSIIDAVEPAR